jgi:cation:H+ antiporter
VQDELVHPRKQWTLIAFTACLTLPALAVRAGLVGSAHTPGPVETILFGVAVLGAAFLLSWGAEVAQLDISQGLAIAFLAFVAVLPEYAVGLVFGYKGGHQDKLGIAGNHACGSVPCAQLTLANMTGANRLLIGLGWAVVVLVWWRRSKQSSVRLPLERSTDLGFMFLATLWALVIVIRRSLGWIDVVVLGAIFVAYLWHVAKEESEHPDLIGPPLAIAALSVARRRAVVVAMFVFSAAVILLAAEPFSHGLVLTGQRFGLNEFLLVQWLAPLASEAPEMIIAILFVLRAKPEQGLGALVSSKVNQWTLLVGTIPIVYGLAFGSFLHPLRLDARQTEEIMLTAAQSLFACAVLANLTISKGEAIGLLVLFGAQFGFESSGARYGFAVAYLVLCVALFASKRAARNGMVAAVRRSLSRPRSEG